MFIVGSVIVCLLPLCFRLVVKATGLSESYLIDEPFTQKMYHVKLAC